MLGAPEFVLLDEYEAYEAKITSLASTGARVLVFGTYDGTIDGKAHEKSNLSAWLYPACKSDQRGSKRDV